MAHVRLTVFLAASLAALVAAPAGRADDAELRRTVRTALPAAERAENVQEQYDRARELELALDQALPVSPGCRALHRAALAFARGRIETAEGIDRLREALVVTGDRRARQARMRLAALDRTCRPGQPSPATAVPQLVEPRSHALTFGLAVAPFGGPAELRVDGRRVARSASGRFRLRLPAGRYDLEVRGPGGRVARSERVWVLPPGAARSRAPAPPDRRLGERLAELGRGFTGYAAFSIRELATGRNAAWNEDARFPAASTVKLGVLVAALARLGTGPRVLPEVRALVEWSSNLAANRLVGLLGGIAPVESALRRLGARASSYPGPYRVGTARGDVVRQPPIVSLRLTTAADLTRAMATLHAATAGRAAALRTSRLTVAEARLALGLLLSSENSGDNAGLLRRALPRLPIAQKHGWISAARHTTAVVYGPRGPVVLTILTYRPELTLDDAQRLGTAVTRLLALT
jgi:beta-lactamase class A